MAKGDKISTPEDSDKIISAKISDKESNLIVYTAVSQLMLHDPSEDANPEHLCMSIGKCSKDFPKAFNNTKLLNIYICIYIYTNKFMSVFGSA